MNLSFPSHDQVGDYTCSAPAFCDVFVERKSLSDLVGTMSSGYDRFKREVERAGTLNHYLVVLVEADLKKCLGYLPIKARGQKIGGGHVMHNVRELIREFNNIQFLFVNDRNEAEVWMKKIFSAGKKVKRIDLQYLYKRGIVTGKQIKTVYC